MGNRESILEQIKVFALENSGFLPVGIQINCTGSNNICTDDR
jgi:hypothetical protein